MNTYEYNLFLIQPNSSVRYNATGPLLIQRLDARHDLLPSGDPLGVALPMEGQLWVPLIHQLHTGDGRGTGLITWQPSSLGLDCSIILPFITLKSFTIYDSLSLIDMFPGCFFVW